MDLFSLIYFTLLAISFLIALSIYFNKSAPLYLKLFPPFLAFTLLIEAIGYITKGRHMNNTPMYNLFTTFEFVFYLWVLHQVVKHYATRIIIFLSIFIYPLIALA